MLVLTFLLNTIYRHCFFQRFLPVNFVRAVIFLCHYNNYNILFNDLPDPILLDKTFYGLSYDVSL